MSRASAVYAFDACLSHFACIRENIRTDLKGRVLGVLFKRRDAPGNLTYDAVHLARRNEDLKTMLESSKDNQKLEAMKIIIGVNCRVIAGERPQCRIVVMFSAPQ